jgi:hypothetical protein
MVLDPMSMRACGCGPFEGLLRMPSTGTQKKKQNYNQSMMNRSYQNFKWKIVHKDPI